MKNSQRTTGVTFIVPDYCCKEPLTLIEASKYTGIPCGTLYQMIHNKQIPCYKPCGQKLFFKRTEMDMFIFRNKQAADYEVSDMADAILNGEESEGGL
jgi:excisionase family DNA binding protein